MSDEQDEPRDPEDEAADAEVEGTGTADASAIPDWARPETAVPPGFHARSTAASAYSVSLHTNRCGNPGSPRVIPAGSNVPATGLIASLTNSSVMFTHSLNGHDTPDTPTH